LIWTPGFFFCERHTAVLFGYDIISGLARLFYGMCDWRGHGSRHQGMGDGVDLIRGRVIGWKRRLEWIGTRGKWVRAIKFTEIHSIRDWKDYGGVNMAFEMDVMDGGQVR